MKLYEQISIQTVHAFLCAEHELNVYDSLRLFNFIEEVIEFPKKDYEYFYLKIQNRDSGLGRAKLHYLGFFNKTTMYLRKNQIKMSYLNRFLPVIFWLERHKTAVQENGELSSIGILQSTLPF